MLGIFCLNRWFFLTYSKIHCLGGEIRLKLMKLLKIICFKINYLCLHI